MSSEQLELGQLPVADPAWAAAVAHEQWLERLLAAARTTSHWDGYAPTTRSLAEHLLCQAEDRAALDGSEFARARDGLAELEGRGLLVGEPDDPGYFGRDDEVTVTRWSSPS